MERKQRRDVVIGSLASRLRLDKFFEVDAYNLASSAWAVATLRLADPPLMTALASSAIPII